MPTLPQTRQTLLIELGRRSDSAWAEFLEVYERAIRGYCRKLGLPEADAEDATQEVLAAVHQRIPTWDHDESRGSFRAWLFRVARNITIDHISERARRAGMLTDTSAPMPLELRATHEESLNRNYRRALLDWAASRVEREVSVAAWKAFTLTAMHGQKPEVVAETLGMSVGAVYTAKSRVIARLRAQVAAVENTGFPADAIPGESESGKDGAG